MKNINILLNLTVLIALSGCVSNKPFNQEQLAMISQHKIIVQNLPVEQNKPLHIYSGSGKVSSEVAQLALGLFLGSYHSKSSGNTPRTRFESAGAVQALTESGRKAAGEEIMLKTPTQTITEMLATKFNTVNDEEPANKDNMVINVKTVAWHLYYSKLFDGQQTYLLEYAADIDMSAPNAKLHRSIPCDKQSKQALTKEEWLANDSLRIRTFTNTVAKKCFQQILSELGKSEAHASNN